MQDPSGDAHRLRGCAARENAGRGPLFMLLLLVCAASPALAIDGVIEINAARAQAGGVSTGDTPGYPVTISERGSYRLTGKLVVQDQLAIDVTADGVSIDLNGYGIECATTCTTGRGIQSSGLGIRIRDGYIRGMGDSGIHVSQRARIHNVDVSENGWAGISAAAGCIGSGLRARDNASRGVLCPSVLRDSSAQDNGLNGLQTTNGVATRNLAVGNGGQATPGIEGNGLRLAGGVGSSNTLRQNAQHGIRIQQPTALIGNTMAGNTNYGIFVEGFGDTGYVDNVLDGNLSGTVFCVIGSVCLEMGGNLCDGANSCP